MSDIIRQGTDCWISASNLIDVRTGLQMNVTGYKVYVARIVDEIFEVSFDADND